MVIICITVIWVAASIIATKPPDGEPSGLLLG
jgi:hypothetical protein